MSIRTVGTLLALTGALAACTAQDERPTVLPPAPSVSASISASASPTPVAPLPVPPEAQEATSQGASAFARYYMKLLNEAYATADATAVRAVSEPTCGGCASVIDAIDQLRADRQRSVGGEYAVLTAVAPAVIQGDVVVDISYERPAGTIVDDRDRVIESAPAVGPIQAQLRLSRIDDDWRVKGFRVVAR